MLILGAGINGCAVARDLVLNGVPVVLVDTNDIASGASSKSSRLIHGGLRYLEHGDFELVRESLEERRCLLRAAPHFVRQIQLFVPIENRLGGIFQSAARFLRLSRLASWLPSRTRGLYLVRLGLWLYDRFAKDETCPAHKLYRSGEDNSPAVRADRYR